MLVAFLGIADWCVAGCASHMLW